MDYELEKIVAIVKAARGLFLNREMAGEIEEKGVADYVTAVDKNVQQFLEEKLYEAYPKVQLMGEEKDNSEIDFSRPVWILDPVDGTTNLIHNYENSSISLALCIEGRIELGIVYHPYLDEMYTAQRGKGAFKNGALIHVSKADKLEDSMISVGTSPYNHKRAEQTFREIREVFLRCQDIRRLGSAALDMAHIASGKIEAYFEAELKPWDFAAGLLLVEEAGGAVTDYDGNPVDLTKKCSVVAHNGRVGDVLVREILGK